MSARLQAIDTAAHALRDWLLDGPAQLASGSEAGGVAGTLGAQAQADYVYGEITGYYLHWLAGSQLPEDPRRQRNALRALAWCERRYGAGERVPTRIALAQDTADWRNDTEFCFDLAMLVGGLSAAAHAGLIAPPRALLSTLLDRLAAYADGDRLLPALPAVGLPARWSTRSGPFLVKAAARIRSAALWVPLPAALDRATRGHALAFAPAQIDSTAEPTHPTLYYLEGALALGAPQPDHARILAELLALSDATGTLPESLQTPAVRRSDIIAQALRVALLLQTPESALAPLADALLARVAADGSIAFQPAPAPQLNVWCAMFAEQALSWYLRSQHEPVRPLDAGELV